MVITPRFPSSYTSLSPTAATQQTNYGRPFTSGSSVTTFTSLRSASADRDLETQRRLLGEEAFGSPDDLVPATPSPLFHQTSPLSVASHLQDEYEQEQLLDPFVGSDRMLPTSIVYGFEPVPKSPTTTTRRKQQSHHRLSHTLQSQNVPLASSAAMTQVSPVPDPSCLGLNLTEGHFTRTHSDPVIVTKSASTDDVISNKSSLRSRAATSPTTLPTIQEVATSRNRVDTPRPSPKPITRAALFPLGPLPEPLPPRKPRYEPPPHIVDLAVERLRSNGVHTPVIVTPEQSPSIRATSPLPFVDMEPLAPTHSRKSWFSLKRHEEPLEEKVEDEKERQWKAWEKERLRALEMTKAAAKDNRPEWGGIVEEQEKPVLPKKKRSSKKFWCFGSSTEMEVDDVLALTTTNEKGTRKRQVLFR